MPNHLHCMLFFPEKGFSLNKIIGNAKRFMAYEMIKRLQTTGRTDLLLQLQNAVSENEKKKNQQHKIFEDSFDAKPITTLKFLLQKLQYIHLNPVRGKYQLVDDWRKYEHSSASFYETGKAFYFTPVHYMDLK